MVVLEEGNCIGHGYIARSGVVQVVEENGDLLVFEIRQQINNAVDGRTRPGVAAGVAFGMHRCGVVLCCIR
jgi:hypothetical protein